MADHSVRECLKKQAVVIWMGTELRSLRDIGCCDVIAKSLGQYKNIASKVRGGKIKC